MKLFSKYSNNSFILHALGITVAIVGAFFFVNGCKTQEQSMKDFIPPESWPTVNMTEQQFREQLDKSVNLDPIEGIWTVIQSGTWRNVLSGINGSLPQDNSYRIAIFRDTTHYTYDYIAIILESSNKFWKSGRIKAYFRKTAYDKAYEALWYMANYSEEKLNFVVDDIGVLKSHSTQYSPDNQYIEVSRETSFLKAYPALSSKKFSNTDKQEKASGSGFIISKSGMVVTNYHVVQDADRIEVVFPEKNLIKEATIKLRDTKNDLVILELKDFDFSIISNSAIPFSFASQSSVKVGQNVFTLGFPLGNILGTKSRLSSGCINSQYGINDDPRLFQISNPLQPGNSGGPLFNDNGEVVGIVVASLNAKFFYDNVGIIPQNVNFAIKVNYLDNLLSMLPNGYEIQKRKSVVAQGPLENKVEQINPFIVQVRSY